MNIKIDYDGEYPNLCAGDLIVYIDGVEYKFPEYCLSSGGSCGFDSDWNSHVNYGDWSIHTWPKDFPEELKEKVIDAVNEQVEHGCCGGCL